MCNSMYSHVLIQLIHTCMYICICHLYINHKIKLFWYTYMYIFTVYIYIYVHIFQDIDFHREKPDHHQCDFIQKNPIKKIEVLRLGLQHWRVPWLFWWTHGKMGPEKNFLTLEVPTFLSNENSGYPGCLGLYRGWNTTQSYYILGGFLNIFYFHPYLGKIPILTNIFETGWNHQLVKDAEMDGLIDTPWKFNRSPLKNDGWKTTFLLGRPICRGGYVRLPGGIDSFPIFSVCHLSGSYFSTCTRRATVEEQNLLVTLPFLSLPIVFVCHLNLFKPVGIVHQPLTKKWLPCRKLAARTWKLMVGRLYFPFGAKGLFSGAFAVGWWFQIPMFGVDSPPSFWGRMSYLADGFRCKLAETC